MLPVFRPDSSLHRPTSHPELMINFLFRVCLNLQWNKEWEINMFCQILFHYAHIIFLCSVKGRKIKDLIVSWVIVGSNLVGANSLETKTSSYPNCNSTSLKNSGCISLAKSKLWLLNLTKFSKWSKWTGGIPTPFAAPSLLLPRQVSPP